MHQVQVLLLRRTDTALAIMRPRLSDRWQALHHPMELLFLSSHKIPMDHPAMVLHRPVHLPRGQLAVDHLLVDQMLADLLPTVLLKATQYKCKALLVLTRCHQLAA